MDFISILIHNDSLQDIFHFFIADISDLSAWLDTQWLHECMSELHLKTITY